MSKSNAKEGWETSDFPILCETCLGENTYMRMTRQVHGDECKVCSRPFTVFRWCPGRGMRFKKTEICQMCARAKNVCQTCVLDLQYNLPVQVRDSILGTEQSIPKSDVNRQFYNQVIEQRLQASSDTYSLTDYDSNDPTKKTLLSNLSRTEPFYKRNLPHVCSFYIKGKCNRGNTCPYRHEIDINDIQPSKNNIKDRFFGSNDPVAAKILSDVHFDQLSNSGSSILVISNLPSKDIKSLSAMLRERFYVYGELEDIRIIHERDDDTITGFVQYASRESSERAIQQFVSGIKLDGKLCQVSLQR